MPKLLVANRGEIAIRILRSAAELEWPTVAIYTADDNAHATFAGEAIELKHASDYVDVDRMVEIAQRTQCTHVHPGYGFLSENPSLPAALSNASLIFVGPSADVLRVASDKMLSRKLAISMGVPVAPGQYVASSDDVRSFCSKNGYPVMIKALDGGGGRGIRLVPTEAEVEESFKRCLGESPSRQVFVEKALMGPSWKHIEVQIIGDGTGQVNHFWERECSVQRKFQKIIELAPSRLPRSVIRPLLTASITLASSLKYSGVGTFEYLFNTKSGEWVFLEINPRIQVEHTVTEEIMDVDLVRMQLLLSDPSTSLASLSLLSAPSFPTTHAVQLRLTAEDPSNGFRLSPGTISASQVTWPGGRGVRLDTWIASGPQAPEPITDWVVGTDFDSLLAKIIVSGSTSEETTRRARRALKELKIGDEQVKTNIELLAGVIDHPHWSLGAIDTMWLERNLTDVLNLGEAALASKNTIMRTLSSTQRNQKVATTSSQGPGTALLQPGSLFYLTLSPTGPSSNSAAIETKHTLTLSSIAHNSFPEHLSGILKSTFSSNPLSFSLVRSTASAGVSAALFELANPNDPCHIASPLTGKVVELHPALLEAANNAGGDNGAGRRVKRGETLMVLSAMKMESSILSPRDALISRAGQGVKLGVVLGEGMLVCGLEQGVASKM